MHHQNLQNHRFLLFPLYSSTLVTTWVNYQFYPFLLDLILKIKLKTGQMICFAIFYILDYAKELFGFNVFVNMPVFFSATMRQNILFKKLNSNSF